MHSAHVQGQDCWAPCKLLFTSGYWKLSATTPTVLFSFSPLHERLKVAFLEAQMFEQS